MSEGRSDHEEDAEEGTHSFPESGDSSAPARSTWGTRLQPGQIRLFNLRLDGGDGIRGSLEVFELESAPEYIAQSYVCGDGDFGKEIVVDGASHHIRPNLFIALNQTKKVLQQPNPSGRICQWLWVDAICIHQTDTKELEMQIRFMEHIYRRAKSTFVSIGRLRKAHRLISRASKWLAADAKLCLLQNAEDSSPPNDDQDRIISSARSRRLRHERALRAEGDLSEADAQDILANLKNRLSNQSSEADPRSQALHYVHPFWQTCMQLFENEWFCRLWTYQELVLSRRLFVTLHYSVPWRMIRALYLSLRHLHNSFKFFKENGKFSIERTRAERFLVRHIPQGQNPFRKLRADRGNIWSLLAITAQRRTRVPKDHVFAILGLMDPDMKDLVAVDYSRTDAQVFGGVVELAMKKTNAAPRLPKLWEAFAWVPAATPCLPSWCPDLNNETDACIGWFCPQTLPKSVSSKFLDAADLRVSSDNGPIFLKVLELDAISQAGSEACPRWDGTNPVLSGESHIFSAEAETLVWIRRLYDTFSSSENDIPAVMIRLLHFFDAITSNGAKTVANLACLITASQLLAEGLTLGEVVLRVRQGLGLLNPELQQGILKTLDAAQDHDRLALSLNGTVDALRGHFGGTYIFATAHGRMGHSPKPVSLDDRVCIVPGGEMLHVFSPSSKRYVTCAAVHGLMEESVLDIVREPGREWRSIAIH
jgi:hypothetical protein